MIFAIWINMKLARENIRIYFIRKSFMLLPGPGMKKVIRKEDQDVWFRNTDSFVERSFKSPYRIFRAVTNHTVKSYILGRRLSAAAIALKNTDLKVVEIAFQYGFNSHELFTQNFLKMFQITPSAYMERKYFCFVNG